MNLDFFTSNLHNPQTLIPAIYKQWKTYFEMKAFLEINPETHKVNNKRFRKDKLINIPDPRGGKNTDGSLALIPDLVKVARISIPLQKLLVSRANAFLTAGNVSFKAKPANDVEQQTFDKFQQVWKRNKCDFKNSEIGKAIYSETECAEIWYTRKNADKSFEIKCNIYKPSDGYELIPVFDNTRDLIAFGLGYQSNLDNTIIKHLDVYTSDSIYKYKDQDGNWIMSTGEGVTNPIPLLYGKIPVIYYSTMKSIWQDVQPMIERLETLMSNFADTNDYNGSPILFAEGEITGLSAKGESGKVIEGTQGSKISYVSWDHAPESIKLEAEKLIDFIYTCTQTPDLSFKEMIGLGRASGVAFDRIMIDAHLKAKDMQTGIYGEGIQRRCNFLVSAISNLYSIKGSELDITPVFDIFKIDDQADRIDYLLKANGNKPLVSHKESIALNGMSDDVDETYNEILNSDSTIQNTNLKQGDKVTIVSGKEKHPSHAGVQFNISKVETNSNNSFSYQLASTQTLTGPLNYENGDLQLAM